MILRFRRVCYVAVVVWVAWFWIWSCCAWCVSLVWLCFGLVVFSVGVALAFGRVSCFRLVAIKMSGWYLFVLTSSCFGLNVVCLCVGASGVGFGWVWLA